MKRLFLATLCMALASYTFAQSRFGYGPKVALNISMVNLEKSNLYSIDNKARIGVAFGAFGTYQVNDWFGLQAEVMYSIQGAKLKFPFNDQNKELGLADKKTGKLIANYINIPVIAKFYPINGLHLDVGPEVGFCVKKKIELDDKKLDANFRTADFLIAVGAGYEFNFGLTVDARYNIGVVDLVKKQEGTKIKSKNGVFQLGVGWRF